MFPLLIPALLVGGEEVYIIEPHGPQTPDLRRETVAWVDPRICLP